MTILAWILSFELKLHKTRNMYSLYWYVRIPGCFAFFVFLFLIHDLGQFIDDDVYAYDDNTMGI